MNKLFVLVCGLLISSVAVAQDYGLTVGLHQTTGKIDTSASGSQLFQGQGSVSGSLGFDVGLTASFELVPNLRFRTGLLYDTQPFTYTVTNDGNAKVSFNFAYLDVPVNLQYNFNPMFGLFGGIIAGIKASDSVSGLPSNAPNVGPGMKSMYPFLNVGANFTFNDLLGFDLYYQTGMGSAADNVSGMSAFGLHFIYWL